MNLFPCRKYWACHINSYKDATYGHTLLVDPYEATYDVSTLPDVEGLSGYKDLHALWDEHLCAVLILKTTVAGWVEQHVFETREQAVQWFNYYRVRDIFKAMESLTAEAMALLKNLIPDSK